MKHLMVTLVILCLCSCSALRQGVIDITEEDTANIETLKQASDNLRATWEFYSGCLTAMKPILSGDIWQIKEQLDLLYSSGEWNDRTAGQTLVLRLLLIKELGQDFVRDAMPGFLDLFT